MTELATFWNDKHPLATKAQSLFVVLVPGVGKCDTVEGELLRASTRITYDWYNNGWGCNNWSGAVLFIIEKMNTLPLGEGQIKRLKTALNFVYDYSHGEPSNHLKYDGATCGHVTTIHEIIVQAILDTPPADWTANTEDMFDYGEEDYVETYDDEEGVDY